MTVLCQFFQHGLIQRSGESLYIQPLPTHLSKHVEHKEISQPHLIVKRSIRENLIFSKRGIFCFPHLVDIMFKKLCYGILSFQSCHSQSALNVITTIYKYFIQSLLYFLYFGCGLYKHKKSILESYPHHNNFYTYVTYFVPAAKATSPKGILRSIESSNKYLEAALVTDEITAEKYGESKIASILLIIGNIVSYGTKQFLYSLFTFCGKEEAISNTFLCVKQLALKFTV